MIKQYYRLLALPIALLASANYPLTAFAKSYQDSTADAVTELCTPDNVLTIDLRAACNAFTADDSEFTEAVAAEEFATMAASLQSLSGSLSQLVLQQLLLVRKSNATTSEPADKTADLKHYYGGSAGNRDATSGIQLFASIAQNDGEIAASDFTSKNDQEGQHALVGIDHRITTPWLIGLALGRSDGKTGFESTPSSIEFESDHAILFSSWYRDQFAVDTSIIYSRGTFTSSRTLPDARANSETDHDLWAFNLSGRFDFSHDRWEYGPMASLDIMDSRIDSFSETGDSVWALSFAEQEIHSFIYSVGLHFAYRHSTRWGIVTPYGSTERRKEFRDRNQTINSSFNLYPQQSLDLERAGFDNYWFRSRAGIAIVFHHGISAYLDYSRIDGYTDTNWHSASLGLRAEF